MKNISDKSVEKFDTHVCFQQGFVENFAVYETIFKNIVELSMPQMTM
jgi:hypothetical protein